MHKCKCDEKERGCEICRDHGFVEGDAFELTWRVELTISGTWVADGFNMDREELIDMLQNHLECAYEHELDAKVLKAPDPKAIEALQGSRDASLEELENMPGVELVG